MVTVRSITLRERVFLVSFLTVSLITLPECFFLVLVVTVRYANVSGTLFFSLN